MPREPARLAARTVSGAVWLDVKVWALSTTGRAIATLTRKTIRLLSRWREPAGWIAVALTAWWVWPPLLALVLAAETVWVFRFPHARAVERERRDRLTQAHRWRRPRPVRWADRTAWALTRDGRPVPCPLPGSNVLIGGIPGAGKSVAINGALAILAPNPWVHFVGIELKGGVELVHWQDRFDLIADHPGDALDLIDAADRWLEDRLAKMKAERLKGIPEPCGAWPHVVFVIDEAASLPKKTTERLTPLINRGRAGGLWFMTATQHPLAEVIPTTFRDVHNVTLCGAVRVPQSAQVIAGSDVFSSDADWGSDAPWRLDVSAPAYRDSGRFMLVDPYPRPVRVVHRSDAELAGLVAETAWVAAFPEIVP